MLRAAIIGLGNWGKVLVNSVQGRSERIHFVAAATRTPENAAGFAARHGIELLPDFEAVVARDDLDAVVLATPHSQHYRQIVALAGRGRHIFCEKPLTLTLDDARAAYDAADKAGILLAPGQNRRFLPAYRKLQELVLTGALGEVRQVIGNFSWSAPSYRPESWRNLASEAPAGGMTGLGIHVVDAMIGLGLAGEAVTVTARGGTPVHTLSAMVEYAGGTIGLITTMSGPGKFWRLEVFGSDGYAAMDGETRLSFSRNGEPVQSWDFGVLDMEKAELESFADTVAGRATWPVPRDQALSAIALFEAICSAAETPGERISVAAG